MYHENQAKRPQLADISETGAAAVSPVEGATNSVSFEQDITAGLISDLQTRLGVILRPVPPATDKAEQLGRMTHSHLHGKLNELVARQEGFNTSLRSLLDRLTV